MHELYDQVVATMAAGSPATKRFSLVLSSLLIFGCANRAEPVFANLDLTHQVTDAVTDAPSSDGIFDVADAMAIPDVDAQTPFDGIADEKADQSDVAEDATESLDLVDADDAADTPFDVSCNVLCDDGNPCTVDECAQEGCTHTLLPDDELVTTDCTCALDIDCAPLNDDDFCNGLLFCDTQATIPHCAVNPATVIVCDDGLYCNGQETCVPATGLCQASPPPQFDGTDCTLDLCNEESDTIDHPPSTLCFDDDPCTIDLCHGTGDCTWTPVNCDDANSCTSDSCQASNEDYQCLHQALDCDDGNVCTDNHCDPDTGKCLNPPLVASCDDGNACTLNDSCFAGVCTPGGEADCDDGNPCTVDSCLALAGCQHLPNSCDDQDACTIDLCEPDIGCIHEPLNCDDQNDCTVDSCLPESGCSFLPDDGKSCPADNNPCTEDMCQSGSCQHVSNGWEYHAPYGCFKVLSDYRRSWLAGREACQAQGGDLATLYDESLATTLTDQVANQASPDAFWVGLNDRAEEGGYQWANGGASQWLPWGSDQPSNTLPHQDCAAVDPVAGLHTMACNETLAWTLCERNPPGTTGATFCDDQTNCTLDLPDAEGGCQHVVAPDNTPCADDGLNCTKDRCVAGTCTHDAGNWVEFAPFGCFQRLDDAPLEWTAARTACIELGGDLATIYSEPHATWLATHWDQEASHWIGYTDIETEGDFQFANGGAELEPFDIYSDLYLWMEHPGAREPTFDCAALRAYSLGAPWGTAGRLKSEDCNGARYAICEKNPPDTCGGSRCATANPCDHFICSPTGECMETDAGWHYAPPYGCYRALDGWFDWPAARTACSTEGGHLATLYDEAHAQWFNEQFVLPLPCDADFGCPTWLGLNDRGQEALLRWETGNSPYTDFPDSGSNNGFLEDCAAITPEADGSWQMVPCQGDQYTTVCERNPPGTTGGRLCQSDSPCTGGWPESTGACASAPAQNGLPCPEDGDTCSEDICWNGQCTHPGAGESCDDPAPTGCIPACKEDDNPCTTTTCVEGECIHDASGYVHFPPWGCYKVHRDQTRTHNDAATLCTLEGAHLATLCSAEHMDQLSDWLIFTQQLFMPLWLGLTDSDNDGEFDWSPGNSTFFYWADGEPIPSPQEGGCALLKPAKKTPAMISESCSKTRLTLCERNPAGSGCE